MLLKLQRRNKLILVNIVLLLTLVFFLNGCGSPVVKVNEYAIKVKIADTLQTRTIGLMFRESLCDECGMLFVFDEEDYHGFWMKNTKIPLDIVFISNTSKVVDILSAEPCVKDPCPVYLPREKARYALEINRGRSGDYQIKKDVIVDLPLA